MTKKHTDINEGNVWKVVVPDEHTDPVIERAIEDARYYLDVWEKAPLNLKPAPPIKALRELIRLARAGVSRQGVVRNALMECRRVLYGQLRMEHAHRDTARTLDQISAALKAIGGGSVG